MIYRPTQFRRHLLEKLHNSIIVVKNDVSLRKRRLSWMRCANVHTPHFLRLTTIDVWRVERLLCGGLRINSRTPTRFRIMMTRRRVGDFYHTKYTARLYGATFIFPLIFLLVHFHFHSGQFHLIDLHCNYALFKSWLCCDLYHCEFVMTTFSVRNKNVALSVLIYVLYKTKSWGLPTSSVHTVGKYTFWFTCTIIPLPSETVTGTVAVTIISGSNSYDKRQ